jgi:hypothetical protein
MLISKGGLTGADVKIQYQLAKGGVEDKVMVYDIDFNNVTMIEQETAIIQFGFHPIITDIPAIKYWFS